MLLTNTPTAIVMLSLLTLPVAAEAVQCTFITECFEAEACADSAFTVAIEEKDGATLLVSDAESFPVSVGGSDAVRIYVGVTDSAFNLMSLATDGTARYSTHLYDGPLMVNYLGNCEGAD